MQHGMFHRIIDRIFHLLPAPRVSFKFRLTFWYSFFATVTLLIFIAIVYYSATEEVQDSLDSSMLRVATSLDYIVRKKQQETQQPLRPAQQQRKQTSARFAFLQQDTLPNFVGPLRPQPDTARLRTDPVWTAVYEHILLNPKNYLIQIADSSGQVVWKSANLRDHVLPTAKDLPYFPPTVPAHLFQDAYWQDGEVMRVLFYRSDLLQITIAYAISEVRSTLNELFSLMLYLLPIIFFVSLAGGWWLASYSLQPIEKITQTAREITARRLDQRIPSPPADDEIARLVATLNDMIARLEASFQQIRQFTSDVSHELRTPLSILMGELELALRSRRSPEEYERILSTALEEVVRLSKLVQNLLELSRAETGQINLTMEQLDLSLLLHDIVEDAEILAEAKNIQVHSSIETPLWIQGDKHRLYQAFLNLVDNAVKYTPENQTIAIRGARQGKSVVVEIEDTGIGIPEKEIPLIFRRFYRVDKARSRKIQGQGLGLAIVQWIIHSHGGEIQVESTPGKGSCFRVILPAVHPEQVPVTTASVSS